MKWLTDEIPTVADTKTTPHAFFDPLKAYRLIHLTARTKKILTYTEMCIRIYLQYKDNTKLIFF